MMTAVKGGGKGKGQGKGQGKGKGKGKGGAAIISRKGESDQEEAKGGGSDADTDSEDDEDWRSARSKMKVVSQRAHEVVIESGIGVLEGVWRGGSTSTGGQSRGPGDYSTAGDAQKGAEEDEDDSTGEDECGDQEAEIKRYVQEKEARLLQEQEQVEEEEAERARVKEERRKAMLREAVEAEQEARGLAGAIEVAGLQQRQRDVDEAKANKAKKEVR
jgi:hypothetical protein